MRMLFGFTLSVTFLASFNTFAADVDLAKVSQQQDWRNLLHIPRHSNRSEIENQAFFLADNGRNDAEAELRATLALFQQEHVDNNDHPQCIYPARFFWLQQQGLLVDVERARCTDFSEWAEVAKLESSSLIFADGFLGNPASFYGHLLLKNNTQADEFGSELLNNSMNFGAAVSDDENPIVYILKGLFGGYQATYSASHFYRYNLNYAEAELRDLWNYELNISVEQAYLLAAHNWELLNTAYTYYFTHRNCAYHLGRTLELVTDQPMMPAHEPFVFPIAVVNRIFNNTINGEPAVRSVRHVESRQSRFRRKFLQLSNSEQHVARRWVETEGDSESDFLELNQSSRIRVLDVLADYYEFQLSQQRNDSNLKQRKNEVLVARMQLPAGAEAFVPANAIPPHQGVGGSMLQPRLIHNSELGAGVDLTYRIAYYDMLTPNAGKAPDSALSMGELGVRWHQDTGLELAKLWAVNIESLNINPTGLPGDGGRAWILRAGWQRNYVSAAGDDLQTFLRGGIGKAWQFGSTRLYTMLDGQLTGGDDLGNKFAIMPRVGFTYEFERSKVQCETRFIQANRTNSWAYTCDARAIHGSNWDMRIGIAHEDYTEGYLGVTVYW
ncbi:hypothetical protein CWE13_05165 [Aliidiomarina shirensis]|uniref:Uncharacterized protein n=1 Tax=Aliidiomarina shirensis TaxID=1048642 RepID=A0A432WUB9_9GAMM|nr:DUF4105 domain-containing protein [Aliidiomarina shirensis]RUO37354.1 hypothetical protein CWE13_05165 [Aliidiomarina shirensis]